MKKTVKIILALLLLAVAFVAGRSAYRSRYARKHSGHGFKYMNGFSSTDFTGYHVYDGEKLAVLDEMYQTTVKGIEEYVAGA